MMIRLLLAEKKVETKQKHLSSDNGTNFEDIWKTMNLDIPLYHFLVLIIMDRTNL